MTINEEHSFYFIAASWAVDVVLLVIMLLSKFLWHLPMGGSTIALWAVAMALPLPAFYLMYRLEDDFREWQLHTLFTMIILTVLGFAMCLWIGDGYVSESKDGFLTICSTALAVTAIWGAYTAVNLALYLYCVFNRNAPAVPEGYEPAPAPAALPVGDFQQGVDSVLSDIDRFNEMDANDNGGR